MKVIDYTRLNNDVNGNPRYVVHFLTFITDQESANFWALEHAGKIKSAIHAMYDHSLEKTRRFGGKKYHTKSFGGGIVFQCYGQWEIEEMIKSLEEVTK